MWRSGCSGDSALFIIFKVAFKRILRLPVLYIGDEEEGGK
jgi:hypothetical protein